MIYKKNRDIKFRMHDMFQVYPSSGTLIVERFGGGEPQSDFFPQ